MDTNKRYFGKFLNIIMSYGMYLILVIVFIIYSITAERFLSIFNINRIMYDASPLIMISIGLALVIISKSIDISVGSIAFLSSTIGIFAVRELNVSPLLSIVIILLVSILCGLINGFLIVRLDINPLIITLGMMISLRGIAIRMTSGSQWTAPKAIQEFGTMSIGPVHLESILVIIVLILVQIVLSKTLFGRYIYLIGCDTEAAKSIGINVKFIKMVLFIFSGFFAGVAGIFLLGKIGSVSEHTGYGMEFLAIAVITIGGISLFGGKGTLIPGLLVGAITLIMIENGLNYLGFTPYGYPLIRGLIIFVAMFVDSFRYKKRILGNI